MGMSSKSFSENKAFFIVTYLKVNHRENCIFLTSFRPRIKIKKSISLHELQIIDSLAASSGVEGTGALADAYGLVG